MSLHCSESEVDNAPTIILNLLWLAASRGYTIDASTQQVIHQHCQLLRTLTPDVITRFLDSLQDTYMLQRVKSEYPDVFGLLKRK